MKLLLSCVFLLALTGAAFGSSAYWGARNSTDVLLSRELVVRVPQRNNYWSVNVQFPKSGYTNQRIISVVQVIDNFRNASGATPALYSGGPGYRFATINLSSYISQGINSTVEIWGRR